MNKRDEKWLFKQLNGWAYFVKKMASYPGSTTIWRAMREGGQIQNSNFTATIPLKELPEKIQEIEDAMWKVRQTHPIPITAMRYWWTMPEEKAAECIGYSVRTLYRYKKRGEELLLEHYKRHDDPGVHPISTDNPYSRGY